MRNLIQQAVPGPCQGGADPVPQPQVWLGGSQMQICPWQPSQASLACLRVGAEPASLEDPPSKSLIASQPGPRAHICIAKPPVPPGNFVGCAAKPERLSPGLPSKSLENPPHLLKIPILKPGVGPGLTRRRLRTANCLVCVLLQPSSSPGLLES